MGRRLICHNSVNSNVMFCVATNDANCSGDAQTHRQQNSKNRSSLTRTPHRCPRKETPGRMTCHNSINSSNAMSCMAKMDANCSGDAQTPTQQDKETLTRGQSTPDACCSGDAQRARQRQSHQNTTQVTKKGDSWHDELPQQHQHPGIERGRHIEETKDAPLHCTADVVVDHDESKDDS